MTYTRSQNCDTTAISWVMNKIAAPRSRARWRSSCSTWRCTVTSSAVVGSSAISSAGSQENAIATMTRWRMPPESSKG